MSGQEVSLAGISVMLGMPVNRDLPWDTALSLINTQTVMQDKGITFEIKLIIGTSIVELARNQVVHAFLDSTHDRLAMIDSDMVWSPDDWLRLLARSTQMDCVSGAYVNKCDNPQFQFASALGPVNEYGCYPVDGLGLGFTIVRRNPIEHLAQRSPHCRFLDDPVERPRMFRCDVDDGGHFRGEDNAFFADLRSIGVQPFIDPKITLGHVGRKNYVASLAEYLSHKEKVQA